jgi:hypothetical protein
MMKTRTHRMVVAMIVAAILVATGTAFWLWRAGRDDSASARAFFAPATPSSCTTDNWNLTVRAHFSAFVAGSSIKSKEGKFLVAVIDVRNRGGSDQFITPDDFKLVVPSGKAYPQILNEADPPWPTAVTSDSFRSELVFDIPLVFGAGKLVFDSGCAHQEWIVP